MTDAIELRNGPLAQGMRRHRLVAILRRVEPQEALFALVDELADAGVRIVEITFDSPTAAQDLRALRQRLDARSDGPFYLGAGTLLRREQLDSAIGAGAQFCVSPVMELDLLKASLGADVPFTATGMTSTEMNTAWNAGATFIKLFPASAVGPQFIRELHGPLPDIQIVPSGGVDASNARAFLDAGAVAIGLSGALVRATSQERRALIASLA
jgi:2-dehydro-3-deoxyphosphogluconate aldolase / (4S)-4-hydroxy-2-oxoglutarate aldolase